MSDHAARELRAVRAGFVGHRCAIDRSTRFRDHVHHGEERAVAVERRCRAADDFHALECGRIETELRADFRLAEHVVVDAMAVDEQENAAVVVARLAEPTRTQEAEVAVVAHVQTAHAMENVGERAVAVTSDVLCGDERHRRGGLGHRLAAFRRAEDAAGVEPHRDLQVRARTTTGQRSSFRSASPVRPLRLRMDGQDSSSWSVPTPGGEPTGPVDAEELDAARSQFRSVGGKEIRGGARLQPMRRLRPRPRRAPAVEN